MNSIPFPSTIYMGAVAVRTVAMGKVAMSGIGMGIRMGSIGVSIRMGSIRMSSIRMRSVDVGGVGVVIYMSGKEWRQAIIHIIISVCRIGVCRIGMGNVGMGSIGMRSIAVRDIVLINDNHIRLFQQYKVHVGISIDGPGELNDVRWTGTLERTREMTANTERAIERLCQEGISPSLIVTLHRCNATTDKLPILHDWFRYLESIGITHARLHILEVENDLMRQKYVLTTEENVAAFLSFAQLERELTNLKFDVFTDMRKMLLGDDSSTTCIWNACDPYTTAAVRGVEGNGQSSNCGRTNKDGIDFTKADTPGFERYIALYHTPQEHGGCNGCRFFLMCKGNCPGTAIDGDWRNRTEHCEVWKQLYGYLEAKLIDEGEIPLSIRSVRRSLEQAMLHTWASGQNTNLYSALNWLKDGNSGPITLYYTDGDHTDYTGLQPETTGAAELSDP